MKKILLKSIELLNFKGIEQLRFDFSTNNSILGKNGSGKTTIMDAFNWCLFGKNSANKQDFSIKTLTTSGEIIYRLDHSVEIELQIGDDLFLIKRLLKEQWKREVGTVTEGFKNTTMLFINGISMKEKEFVKNLTQLLGTEEDIKILSNTVFFSQMDWKDRREYIFKNCEIPSDEEILNKNPDFKDVFGLNVASLNSKVKELERKKAEIPAKIEELSSMIVNFDIENLKDERATLEAKLSNNTSIRITEIKNKLLQIKMEFSNTKANLIEEINKLKIISIQKQSLEKNLLSYMEQKGEIDKGLLELRQAYVKAYNEKLEITENAVCPTCGQVLTGENLEKHLTEVKARFEAEKHQKLLIITSQGKPLRQTSDRLQADIIKTEGELKAISEKNITEKEIELQNALNSLALENNSEYLKYEKELNQITNAASSEVTDKETKQALAEINSLLIKAEYSKEIEAKIKKLRADEKALTKEIVEIECQIFKFNEFQKIKIKEVEAAINSQFKNVQFNLFKKTLNGNVNECCEILVNGVPFADVNTAGKINAALEIIKVFSVRTQTYYPIFIDNRESVTTIIDMDNQVINLKVSDDEKLKIVA